MNFERQSENITSPKIATEIKQMAELDQDIRNNHHEGEPWDGEVDIKHTERMKEIVTEIGWPTRSKVGEFGENRAWLILQHAVHDPDFQALCLKLIKEAPVSEVDQTNIPYLEDRVNLNQGKGQIYGTQFTIFEGKCTPSPIEDETNLDIRRAKVGMGPMQEQIEMMNLKYPTNENS